MNDVTRILIIEDQIHDYELAQREIRKSVDRCVFERVESRDDFQQALEQFQPEIILADYSIPGFNGMEALKLARSQRPSTPVIVWTGAVSEDVMVECMKAGASNYVLKDNMKRLGTAMLHALEERQLRLEHQRAQQTILNLSRFPEENPSPVLRVTKTGNVLYANPTGQILLQHWNTVVGSDLPHEMKEAVITSYEKDLKQSLEAVVQDQIYSITITPIRELGYVNLYGNDVTELKQAKGKFQSIFENSPVGIFQSTPQGQFLSANPAMARIYGYGSPEEMINVVNDIASQIYIEPEERHVFTQLIEAQGVVEDFEWKSVRKDGGIFWTSTSARVVRDGSGNILYYEGFLQDITERKLAEERLADSERRFRSLIENGVDHVSLIGQDGALLWEDPSLGLILGYEPGRFLGMQMFELIHPDDLVWLNELFAKLIREPRGIQTATFRVRHHDGNWRWIEATETNMLEEPSVNAVVISYRDVTERKNAEESLRESEERYRLLFEGNPMPMWIYESETLRFLKVNDAAVAHYGYSREDFLSMTIKDIRPSNDLPRLMQAIAGSTTREREIARQGTWRHCKKDGTTILVEVISQPLIFEGRKAELILAMDVTQRHQAEVEIQQRNDDLALINTLNEAMNQGQGLDVVVKLLRTEIKRIFEGEGLAIYLLTPDGRSLKMQQYVAHPEILRKLEQMIGRSIPGIEIPIQEGGYFQEVLHSGQGRITSDPAVIQKWMEEFTETTFLPRLARTPIRKLIPRIFSLLNIKSTILIPLVSNGKPIGLMDISGPKVFSPDDLKRVENIAGQLTLAIRRSQMEAVLKEERNLLRTLIDNIPDRIYAMDMQGRKTLSNTADWKASGGKTMEDVIGKTDFDTYPPELAEQFWELDWQVLDSGKPVINFEEPGLDLDGNPVSILTTKIPLRNEEGTVIGLVGVGRDITERKQMEEAEREQRALAEALRDTSQILSSSLDYGEVLDQILASVGRVVPHNAGTIMLVDGDFARVVRSHGYDEQGDQDGILGIKLPLSETKNLRQILETGQSVIIHDTHAFEGWKRLPVTEWLRASLGAPISIQGEVIGFICLDSNTPRFFTPLHADRLQAFANQAALAIQNARLLQKAQDEITERKQADIVLKQRNDDLALLNKVNEAVVKGQNLDSIVELLSEELKRIFSAVGSTIYMLSPDQQTITMQQYSFSPETAKRIEKLLGFAIPKLEFPVKEGGYFHKTMVSKRSAITSEPQAIKAWLSEFLGTKFLPPMTKGIVRKLIPQIYKLLNIRSTIIVPLISGKDILGFLDLSSSDLFTVNDLNRVEYIAGQLTTVIQRQQAETAEREQRILAEALRDTAQILNSSLSYEEVLDYILAMAGRVVAHDAATIMLIEEDVARVVRAHGYQERGLDVQVMKLQLSLADVPNLQQMVLSGQPLIIQDTHSYPGWQTVSVATDWIRCNMGAPISILGNVIGFILLDSETPGLFTPVHAERLRAFANQAALAIQNAHLLQQAQNEIAERKQAEQALRESEQRYRTIFENSPVSIWEEDFSYAKAYIDSLKQQGVTDFRAYFASHPKAVEECARKISILDVNNAGLKMYKAASKAELIQSTSDAISQGEREHNHEDFIAIAEGRTSNAWEGADETMTNEPLEISLKWSVAPGHEQDFSKVYVTVVDITERKRAEQELRKEQEKAQTYLDIAGVMMLALDRDGNVSLINQRGLEILGFSNDEIIGKNWIYTFIPESLRGEMQDVFDRLMRDEWEPLKYYENPVLTKNGEQRIIAWHNTLIRNEDGMIITSLSSGEDITERKRSEQELRDSEERFRQLATNIDEAFWITDARSGEEIYLSPAVEKIWGRPVHQLKQEANSFLEAVFPEDRAMVIERIEREKQGEKVEMEYRVTRPDGSVRWIWDRAFPIFDEARNVVRLTGIAADITDRKEVEEKLRASEERYHSLFHHLTDGFALHEIIIDDNGQPIDSRILEINPAFAKLTGLTAEQVIGQRTNEVLPSIENERFISICGQVALTGEPANFEQYSIPLGRYYEVNAYSPRHGQFAVTFEDITERKQAETALQESQVRYQDLFDKSPISLWEEDYSLVKKRINSLQRSGVTNLSEYLNNHPEEVIELASLVKIIDVNKASLELFHADRKEDLLRDLTQVLDSDVLLHFQEELLGLMSPARRFVWEGADKTFDGSRLELLVTGTIPSGYEENWSKVIISIIDITERKQAENALRASDQRFTNAFEFAPIGKALVSLDGHFLKANSALSEILGYTNDELVAKTFQELTHPDDLGISLNHLQQALSGQITSYQIEKRYFHKTGKIVWILLSVSLVRTEEGDPEYFIAQIQDITENKRTQAEVHRRGQETAALLETSLALTNLDLQTILQSLGRSAQNLFLAEGCRMFLIQPDGETLRCVLALQDEADAFSNLKLKLGEGVTGAVALSGKAEIVNEMQNDPRAVQVAGTEEYEKESIIFAPLKERDHTIGVLSVRRAGNERPFQPSDLELLEAFASMAASAVSNARLYEEAQRRLSEAEALYENGLVVGRLLEPKEIAEHIIQTFARHLSWHHVAIRLLRPETEEMELIAYNFPDFDEEQKRELELNLSQRIQKSGQGITGSALQTGIAIRTGNVHAHPEYVNMHPGIQSGLYMPLKVADRVIGVISVESELPDAFTEQDQRLLATLASQAAISFENARLYQAAQQEIFERKRAQDALWASETHYRQLADSITDILFEMDYDLRCTHWNKASEMFSGIPADDAIGHSMQAVFGSEDNQLWQEQIYRGVLHDRQARMFENSVTVRGQKLFLEINAYPSAQGVAVVAKDVTERKLAEMLLQKRFELMEYAARHSLEELMQKTIDEISELTESHIGFLHFVEDDEKTISLQMWSTETIQKVGTVNEYRMHYPVDSAGVWANAVRQRQPVIHNDYRMLADRKGLPAGHVDLTREMVIPILRNDKITAVLGVGNKLQEYTLHDLDVVERFADYAWDIAERKQMENQLAEERNQLAQRVEERTADLSRANSNLARALRVKDEFLANMSHELRTPLNAILGLSESLSEQVAGPLNEKQQKYLSTINESGHHLLSLINDILDLAKIEAGQITLDINKVDVNSVCQASLRMIKQLAQRKNQEVNFEIDHNLGLMWADERRLKQMIVNLLSNAVKFTPDSAALGLEVRGDRAGNKVSITVWDQGIGISDNDLQRLFKPFVQLDAGLAREATGTGLGLALVAQMARLHGGSVTVESQLGKGSRFSILLPWEPALAAEPNTRLRTSGKFRAINPNEVRPTILLIEDTHEVVMMLVDYLEMAGFNMVTAQDGIDGLTQAKLSHPDLILMDIQMPRMDGFETTKKLRTDPEFKDTPIIALTALAMPNDRERCLSAGMNEYLSKPVNLKALAKTIKTFLYEPEAGGS